MRAAVLSIGSELLRGDIVDTNAAFLTRQLSRLGFEVQRVEQIGDDLDQLCAAVSRAYAESDVLLCTGGLGPTQDDLTRQTIANALDEEISLDAELVRTLEERFATMGSRMPARNRQQATLIPSAQPIPNPNGSAPGWYVVKNDRAIIALPGPPSEMQPMWQDWVLPHLETQLVGKVSMQSLMTFSVGESTVEERIDPVIHWRKEVTVATYATINGVEIHVTARASTQEEAETLSGAAVTKLRERLGEAIYGSERSTLAAAAGELLANQGLTLAVMESCTGGALSNMITDEAGSSRYFRGGIVAYTREAKARFGVDEPTMDEHGLISQQTAISMARAVARECDADIGLGVTGIAGDEPLEGQSPGTVYVAYHMPDAEDVREIHRPSSRDVVKRFSAQCALDLLRRHLLRSQRITA